MKLYSSSCKVLLNEHDRKQDYGIRELEGHKTSDIERNLHGTNNWEHLQPSTWWNEKDVSCGPFEGKGKIDQRKRSVEEIKRKQSKQQCRKQTALKSICLQPAR